MERNDESWEEKNNGICMKHTYTGAYEMSAMTSKNGHLDIVVFMHTSYHKS